MNLEKKQPITSFPPEKSLFSLPIVWLCFGVPALFSALSALTIFITSDLSFMPTYEGFNHAADAFKFPIALLGIALALVGLCGANHRSEQSKAQMTLTSSQNVFANHFKHLEEFEKYLTSGHSKLIALLQKRAADEKSFSEKELERIAMPTHHINERKYRNLYRKIYPKSKAGIFHADPFFLDYIDEFIKEFISDFKKIGLSDPSGRGASIIRIFENLEDFKNDIFILSIPRKYRPSFQSEVSKVIGTADAIDLIYVLHDYIETLDGALHFDTAYEPSEQVKWIYSLDFARMPEIDTEHLNNLPQSTFTEIFPTKT